jgi:Holliday junction resolvase RusA-like endonuclease
MDLTRADYTALANIVRNAEHAVESVDALRSAIDIIFAPYVLTFTVPIDLVPKERPRAGATGKFYTPAATRKFEAKVNSLFAANMAKPLTFPVYTQLTLQVGSEDKDVYALLGLSPTDMNGDLDNYAKAIFDAGNKIIWKDDKQIAKFSVEEVSNQPRSGFRLVVGRKGLSKTELANLKKFVALKS